MPDEDYIKIKIIILGDSAVGKSSLIRRFVDDRFLRSESATIGYDFKLYKMIVDGQIVQLNIWDTAGSERYSGYITPSFYRNAQGALYVYDVTSLQTLSGVTYWVDQTKQYSGDQVFKILVGNKIDLDGRVVSTIDGSDFAKRLGSLFVETSAKTSENVRDAFVQLVRSILRNAEPRSIASSRKSSDVVQLEPKKPNQGTQRESRQQGSSPAPCLC